MIPFFFTGSIATMLVIWAVQALSYYGIIRKMGFEQGFAFVPMRSLAVEEGALMPEARP